MIEVIKAPIETKIIEEVKPPEPPPPENLPPPQAVTVQPRVEAPPAPRAASPTIISARSCAPTREDYPPAAVRAEATGTTRVRFNVDASGRVSGSELVRSAGPSREHKLLDRIAMSKLSQCQFKPGTDERGNPVGGQAVVEYVWNLE
ncbi:energy transducer TonB [Rubrivivax gelatinosus]|nr:energy transducer TonB [Rubrivivax gelatinosus]